MPEPLLQVRDLRLRLTERRFEVVRGLSYDLMPGQTLAIVGESGSGKSMSVVGPLGLLSPTLEAQVSGSFRFDGTELVGARPAVLRQYLGNRIGVVFQDALTSLDPVMRIGTQIAEGIRQHQRCGARAARARTVELLELVGIPASDRVTRSFPHQLSGGMRQRVLIAMALTGDPELLVADEPTTAIDATIQLQLVQLLQDLKERLGMSLLLITHDLGLVAALSDQALVMYAGEDVETGRTDQVLTRPRHPYTQGLLDSLLDPVRWPDRAPTPIRGAPPDLSDPIAGCAFAPRCPGVRPVCQTAAPPVTVLPALGAGHRCHFPAIVGGSGPSAGPTPHLDGDGEPL